jgi:hypothetical protein
MFGHHVAIVLSCPGWRTHGFSWHHDNSSSGRDIRDRQRTVRCAHVGIVPDLMEGVNLQIQLPEPHF